MPLLLRGFSEALLPTFGFVTYEEARCRLIYKLVKQEADEAGERDEAEESHLRLTSLCYEGKEIANDWNLDYLGWRKWKLRYNGKMILSEIKQNQILWLMLRDSAFQLPEKPDFL